MTRQNSSAVHRRGVGRPIAGLAAVVLLVFGASPLLASEPGFLGRLFRRAEPSSGIKRVEPAASRGRRVEAKGVERGGSGLPEMILPDVAAPAPGSMVGPPANADPLLSRFAVGRTADGQPFGLFLHIFADGTVMDSAGLHHSDPVEFDRLKAILRETPIEQLKRHSEGTASDYLEVAYLVVYQRSGTRLRAIPLSYAGNTSGADPSLQKLHAAIEQFQAHIAGPAVPIGAGMTPAPAGLSGAGPIVTPPAHSGEGAGSYYGTSGSPYSSGALTYGELVNPRGGRLPAGPGVPGVPPSNPTLPQVNPAPPPPAIPFP